MTRKLTFLILALLALIAGPGWGQTLTTYTMTIDGSNSGNNNVHWTSTDQASLTWENVTWNTSVTGTTSLTANKSYVQIGSKANPATNVTIKTDDFAGKTITAVSLTGFCMSNEGPTLTVTAGTSTMIDAIALVKTTSTQYSSASTIAPVTLGDNDFITFSINSTANAAICISEITVTYQATPSTTPSITVNPTSIDLGTVNINEEAEATFTVSQANLTNVITLSAENGDLDPESIIAGASTPTEVSYTITPNAAGEFSDVITISCADLENDIEINVSGTAIDPSQAVTYEKVTSDNDLVAGASYILVCPTKDKAAGAMGTNTYFSSVDATLSDNTATSQNAIELVLGGATDAWTFTTSEGLIGTTAAKSLNHIGNGTTTWTISIANDGTATITSTNSSYGSIKYNASSPRFLNYASGQTAVALYKKVNSSTVATPTFTPAGGTYATAQNVTITCATEGASIYYTLDGTTPTDASTRYTSAITVSETKTIKAIAYSQTGETSSVASATYTIAAPLTTMDAIFAKATAVGATATDVTVTFNNWVISGVKGNNAYLTDGTKGLIIYENGHGFAVGDALSGTVACQILLYQGSAELKGVSKTMTGLTVTADAEISPVTATIDQLSGVNTGSVVTIENLTYNDNELLSDGTNTIKPYNSLYSAMSFTSGHHYNVTGVYLQYNANPKEILPRSADDIEEIISTEQVETPTFSLAAGTYCGEQTVTISTLTEGATIHYTTDDTNPTVSSSVYSSAITVDENMTIKAIAVKEGMDDSEIASAAYVINEPYSIAYSECANGSISGPANACEGGPVEVTATPAQGYMLGTISVNGEEITGTTFTMPDENVTVSATFEVAPLMVTWDLTVVSYDANPTTELIQWSNDVVIMKNERNGSGNNAVNNYIPTGQSSTRFYKNNKLSIIPTDGYIISSVVFEATTQGYATALANSTWTNATASANDKTVTVTPTNGTQTISATIGGTCGFSAVTVYYQINTEPSIEVAETLDLLFTESEGTIEATYLNIDFDNIEINLYTDEACTIELTDDWFVADFVGNGNYNIEYIAEANTESTERKAYIEIYALSTDGTNDITKVITVTQAPAAEKYTVTIAADIQHGEIISIYDEYAEGTTVQLMVEPAANYGLTSWSITKDADGSDTEIVPVYNSEDGVYEFTMPAYDITVSATFENVVTYTRINSIDDLIVSKHYIIVGKDNGTYYAMGSQNDNNRTAIEIEATEAKVQVPTSISLQEFTISGDLTNNYTFYDLDAPGFLYAASSSKNYLKTEETLDDNGKWTIEIDEETGEATIIAQGDNSRNMMRFNSASGLFSCYSSGQQPVYLYMKENDIDNNIYSDTYIDGDISNCILFSVNKGAVLTVTGTIDANIMMFSIVDGSQLIYDDDIPNGMIANRFRKYADNEADQRTAWNLVSVPVKNFNLLPVPGISISGDYDLFSYNEPTHFWKNKENEAVLYEGSYYNQTTVGTGYLFAMPSSNTQALLGGVGTLQGSGQELSFPLSYTETLEGGETNVLKGFNLVGNPFTCNAYVDMEYMVLDEETGSTFIPGDIIKSGDAILVQATAEGQEITFTRNAPTKTENRLDISVSQNRGSIIDNARIRFSGNRFMNKFYLNESSARLYIPQNGEEFAIVSTSSTSGEMPLNFKAEKNGTYTITVNTKNVDAEYLHLIDNMTGMDVDLLASTGSASYTFEAKTTDYASRFKLVFGVNNTASESSDSNFAYMSDGNLVISDIEGEATLQIIDELGRIISTETVSGSYNKALNLKAGLYILNLNGMTQKIVVE